jgi:hypothetical protein
MAVYSALDAVTAAICSTLTVDAMTALAPGGVADDLAQLTSRPCVLVEVAESPAATATLGTKAGTAGRVTEVGVRLHLFCAANEKRTGQAAIAKAVQLLENPPAVSGMNSSAIFHDQTLSFDDVEVAGEKVTEIVAMFRLYVEEAA